MRKNLIGASLALMVAGLASVGGAAEVRSLRNIDGPPPTLGLGSGGGGLSSANGGRRIGRSNRSHQRIVAKARNVRRNRAAHRG